MAYAAQFGTGQVFLSMLEFFFFIIWIWLLIVIFSDIFRSRDLSGWGKALWTIFVVILPYLGVFIYLIVRGRSMHERAEQAAQAQDAAMRKYVQSVAAPDAGGGGGASAELARLADLRDKGVISEAEFQQGKAKALA
jgi:putative oligomerization/nucleic acid binding protein/phospholipase D-like protein